MTRRLLLAVAFGIVLRMAFINAPMVDAFGSMRQTYTAGYTRYMIEEGVTVSGLMDSPSVVRSHQALEIPIYNLLTVFLGRIFGEGDWVYRLTSLIIWLLGALYLSKLLKRIYGENEALYIIWTFTLLPLSIFIGHYYHPEVLSILLSIAVVFHYWFYLEKGRRQDLIISLVALTVALLVRASHFHLFFVLFFLGFSHYGWKLFTRMDTYAFILPVIPAALWSMRVSDLTTEARLFQYIGLFSFRFSPKFLGMILFNRLGGLVLSPVGLPLLVLGIAAAKARIGRTLEFAWLYAALLFIFIVAKGNFHHPHYQATLLVPASIVIGRFLYQIATGNFSDTWHTWWTAIPRPVIAAAFSLFLFFDGIVIYLFMTQPWDVDVLRTPLANLNIPLLFLVFAVSQALLIPVILWIWRVEGKRTIGPRGSNAAILLILIFLTGLFVLHPMYRQDLDYLVAAEAIREFAISHDAEGKFIFSGKKDDADPVAFYAHMHGWAFSPGTFAQVDPETNQNKGWGFIDKYIDQGAEYLAVMKDNRYLKPEHPYHEAVKEEIDKFYVAYETSIVTIYDLRGRYRPAALDEDN